MRGVLEIHELKWPSHATISILASGASKRTMVLQPGRGHTASRLPINSIALYCATTLLSTSFAIDGSTLLNMFHRTHQTQTRTRHAMHIALMMLSRH
jgi:hypothetical protein